jgi:hydrogenase maturation protease
MRIIGLGQPVAGDDGIGHAVLAALRESKTDPGIELIEVSEATALLAWLETEDEVVVVDAVVGAGSAGQVLVVDPGDLATIGGMAVSSHGVGVPQAIELARILNPDTVSTNIRIVGVTIDPPDRYGQTLSPAVAAAIPQAVATIRHLIASTMEGAGT